MPKTIRALVIVFLLACNLLVRGGGVSLGGLLKLFTRSGSPARDRLMVALAALADRWTAGNDRILDAFLTTRWEIEGLEELDLDPNGHYLIISNHVSWVDIFALFRAFRYRVAFLRFFMKHVLIWFPFAGQGCWALDFPFMHRYSREYLEKHPEKRGRDLETTRIACQRYRRIPVAILNFVEGTRFTARKHAAQQSPFRHLLRPRAGGVAFVLASLGDQLDAVLDVTIAYPGHETTFGMLITDRIDRIKLHVRRLDVPREFYSQAVVDGPTRASFKTWLENVWAEKDDLLGVMLKSGEHPGVTPHQHA